MIRIEVPKEITEYEPKMIAGLTTRQLGCAIIGFGLTILFYNTVGKYLPNNSDLKLVASGIILIPFLLLGWVKPYGMKFEKFILTYIRNCVLAPSIRKYKTENYYEKLEKKAERVEHTDKKGKYKKPKKKKYKLSKEAYK